MENNFHVNYNIVKMLRLIKIFSFLIAVVCLSKANAQTEDGVGSQQVNIITDYVPVIADAFKLNDNPSVIDTVAIKPMLKYSVINKQHKTVIILDSIKPAKMKNEAVEKLSNNYLKAGLGNYSSPYAEFFFANLRSKQWQYGAHAKHLSSNYTSYKQGIASFSDNGIDAFGKYFVGNELISLNSAWNRNVNNIYSYNSSFFQPNDYDDKYINNIIDINAKVLSINTDSAALIHSVKFNYYNLNRKLTEMKINTENHFDIIADFSKFTDNQIIGGELKYQFFKTNFDVINVNSLIPSEPILFNLVSFSPYVKAKGSKWNATIGATVLQEFEAKKTRFFPNVWFNYLLVPDFLTIYSSVIGNAKVNSLRVITNDNPFLLNNGLNQRTTTNLVDASIGVKGNFNSKIAYNLSGNYSIINQLQMFQEVTNFKNLSYGSFAELQTFMPSANFHNFQFISVYDNAKYWNLKGNLNYKVSKKLDVDIQATYQNFKMDTSKFAYYKENLNITLDASYSINEKISLTCKAFYIGKRKGLSQQASFSSFYGVKGSYETRFVIYDLPAYVDGNIGVQYKHTKKLSAFLTLNNIFNSRVQRWQHTPTMGFWLMGGVNYSF